MDSTTTTITENSNNIMNKPESFKKTGLGAHLKSAREAMRLTEKEAAARLHLNVSIITLIENENFADGPPATFMRGYLRSYARLLNLSENEITLTLKDLENFMPSSITATPAIQIKPPKDNERNLHWLTYVIVLVLLMLVSVWWSSHSRYVIADVPPTTQATVDAKPAAMPSNATPAEPNATTTTTAGLAQSATPQQKTTETQTPATAAAAATPVVPTTALTVAPDATSTAAILPGIPTTAAGSAAITTPATATPSETPAPTATAETKPSKKSTLSKLKMALPEPDVDYNQDENNNE